MGNSAVQSYSMSPVKSNAWQIAGIQEWWTGSALLLSGARKPSSKLRRWELLRMKWTRAEFGAWANHVSKPPLLCSQA
jgi:hypothetical protein